MIKSTYRKIVLSLVGYYRYLPSTDNNMDMLVKLYPELESKKKLVRTCQELVKEKYLIRERVFVNKKNYKDCLMLSRKGNEFFKLYKHHFIDEFSIGEIRNGDLKGRKIRLRINEGEIFFSGSLRNIKGTSLKYITKDQISDEFKKNDMWGVIKSCSASRICGILNTGDKSYPVYNIKNTNIIILPNTERTYLNRVSEYFHKESTFPEERILLTDSVSFLDKCFRLYEENNNLSNYNSGFGNDKKEMIFTKSAYKNNQKMYLYFCNLEQGNLIEFFEDFEDEDVKRKIRNYIIGINYDKVYDPENQKYKKTRPTYYDLSTYETDDEAGFEFIQQELNKIIQLERLLNDRITNSNETRKLIFYGTKENRIIYEKVFSKFPNTEFVELEKKYIIDPFRKD